MLDRLLTLTEAAEATGCTVEALRQRVKRRKLHAVKGNDGRLRVKLTQADVDALSLGRVTGQPVGQPVEAEGVVKALEARVHDLQQRAAELRADLERERSEHRDERAQLLQRAEELEARLRLVEDRGAEERNAARRELEELRCELAHARRPWWRRIIRSGWSA